MAPHEAPEGPPGTLGWSGEALHTGLGRGRQRTPQRSCRGTQGQGAFGVG